MRKAIWASFENLHKHVFDIPLNKEDAKAIWESISKELPMFALFRSDRASTDEDSEIQDPMKVAVKEALREVENDLAAIKTRVQQKAIDLAQRTVNKLKELDDSFARQLAPVFKAEPKWDSIFKLSLTGDDQIPINKRGSGARRLILISFFRAASESAKASLGRSGVIYAIEEPETSQHPDNQRKLVEALLDLSEREGYQTIFTTHVPGLLGLVPTTSVRYIVENSDNTRSVLDGSDSSVLRKVADNLGVLPDRRVKVLVCLEGPHDRRFLFHMSKLLRSNDPSLPDITSDPRVVLLPVGGSTLKEWVAGEYLKNLGLPEVHIYDRDSGTGQYRETIAIINARNDGSIAFQTTKKEMENYLHPDAIKACLGIEIPVDDEMDVPLTVAEAVHRYAPDSNPWEEIDAEAKQKKERHAKKRLNDTVACNMTIPMLSDRGGIDEVRGWLREIGHRIA